MKLSFFGATDTVTGSRYLLEHQNKKILVDCGLFQGHKELRLRNWEKFPVDPASIDKVILTHAHIDHSGYIPSLIKQGFKGAVLCSQPTKELASILLPDSGHLHEEDARRANKYGYSKHKPALPLYTELDARKSLKNFKALTFGKNYKLFDDVNLQLNRMGHILGASSVTIKYDNTSILFSGDIGRQDDPIMYPPAQLQGADYLVVESTYGDRRHHQINPLDELEKIIMKTYYRGGSLIVPAFAVGRSQMLMYYICKLKHSKRIPNIPVFLDSPLAIKASEIFSKHANEVKLSHSQVQMVCDAVEYVGAPEQSKMLDQKNTPSIILSASGMATGGRILHHLKYFITDSKNTILFTGYQSGGTRGDKLVQGIDEIKIHGELFPVRAHIKVLHNMSAHADYEEIIEWLSDFTKKPKKVFITHGEAHAAIAMKKIIEDRLGWYCEIPKFLESVEL